MKTVTTTGGDLYRLALQYLGDATQWNRIAQANNLLDPVIVGNQTLNLPSVNPEATGGILVI
jgi:nucleoid-associated protein YgaU